MLYANNTEQFSYVISYIYDNTIDEIDLSSDNNYLVAGSTNTNSFDIRVSENLFQKKMVKNAEIILFACSYGGVLIVIILYNVATMNKTKINVDSSNESELNCKKQKIYNVGMQNEDTQIQLNNKS